MINRKSAQLAAVAAACLSVAGCGGGSDSTSSASPPASSPPPSSDYPTFHMAAATVHAGTAEFQAVDPSAAAEASLRSTLGVPPLCSGVANANCASAHNYLLQNIHIAHTATLPNGDRVRGKGQLIAIVDDGFLLTHQELAGKSIKTYPGTAMGVDDHGTAVAAIAAGLANGTGMMGVAPEADLHLSSWEDHSGPGQNVLTFLAATTDDARLSGAVAQNNSWGWATEKAASQELTDYSGTSSAQYAQHITGRLGGTAAEWQNLFAAYDRFQQSGVIVFANSNNSSLGDASAWASLPLFVPELREAWIAVSNALFAVDSNTGDILKADLLSAPCGSAAPFCLTADGSVYKPTASSDTAYSVATGTSFAAPQISGDVALLAQAFPNLSPAEITVRLLATARNDWAGFQSTRAGTSTFAPGVTHDYSSDFGHGVPDMEAALSPVGGLSIASGSNLATATMSPLDGGVATSGPMIGNAVARALGDREIMVVDRLGTDFYVPATALTADAPGFAATDRRHLARNVDQVAASFAFAEMQAPALSILHDAAVPKLFFSQSLANLDGISAFSQIFPLGQRDFLQFSGSFRQSEAGSDAGFSVARLTRHQGFATELSFAFGHSTSNFFGWDAPGPFLSGDASGNFSSGLSVSLPVDGLWTLSAYAELGSAFVNDDAAMLVDYGSFAYAAGGVTARRRSLFTARDTIDFYAGMRPKAVAGKADLQVPVGRGTDGSLHYENVAVDLADADIPLRLGFVYRNMTEQDFELLLGFNTDFTATNEVEPVFSLSAGLRKQF